MCVCLHGKSARTYLERPHTVVPPPVPDDAGGRHKFRMQKSARNHEKKGESKPRRRELVLSAGTDSSHSIPSSHPLMWSASVRQASKAITTRSRAKTRASLSNILTQILTIHKVQYNLSRASLGVSVWDCLPLHAQLTHTHTWPVLCLTDEPLALTPVLMAFAPVDGRLSHLAWRPPSIKLLPSPVPHTHTQPLGSTGTNHKCTGHRAPSWVRIRFSPYGVWRIWNRSDKREVKCGSLLQYRVEYIFIRTIATRTRFPVASMFAWFWRDTHTHTHTELIRPGPLQSG